MRCRRAGLVLATLVVLTACSGAGASSPAKPVRHALYGDVLLHFTLSGPDTFRFPVETACSSAPGGLSAGATVTVSDRTGQALGTGSLNAPHLVVANDLGHGRSYRYECAWMFEVHRLPDRALYTISVPGVPVISASRSFLSKKNWVYVIRL